MRHLKYERQWVRLWELGGRMTYLSAAGPKAGPGHRDELRLVTREYEAVLAEIRRIQQESRC